MKTINKTVAIANLLLMALLCLSSFAWGTSSMQDFTLARDRKCLVSIIVPKGADPIIQAAANDLAAYIEKASGARPSVDYDGSPVDGPAIHIGQTAPTKAAGLLPDDLSDEGYVIVPNGADILIIGRTPDGTVNGVYGFLRDNLGVRWFMPGELWEAVPKTDPLVVKVAETRSDPDFSFRIWGGGTGTEYQSWLVRNRLTRRRSNIRYFGFGHNLGNIIIPSKHGKEHPEYFAEIDGARILPEKDGPHGGEPCFTNPDVIRLAIEAARAYFDKDPTATQFSLCINDDPRCCNCPNCAKLDSPYQMSRNGKQYSDSYYYFVTQVANEVAKTHPDKTLGCYAYWPVELPPRHIERLPDNVVIALTQDTSQHFDPKYKAIDRDIYLKWCKVASHMVKYDYYGLGWFTPRYYPHLVADDLKFVRKNGVVGHYCEICPYWIMTGPQLYMAAQLLWDTDQDPDALLDEYFTSLYGNAAPTMKRFYSTLERIWAKERPGRWFQGLEWINTELINFDADAMTQAMRLLDKAHAESDGIVRERVDYVRRFFRFSYVIVAGYDAAMSLKEMQLENRADADKSVREMRRVLSLASDAERIYSTTLKVDPLHQTSYYAEGKRFRRKFYEWEDRLANQVVGRLIRLQIWAEKNMQPVEAREFLDQTVAGLPKDTARQMVDAMDALTQVVNFAAVLTPVLEAGRAPGGIAVDGKLDDWAGARWTAMTDSDEKAVAEFALAWDAQNLYIACKVQDRVHLQKMTDASIWLQDSLQIALDPLHDGWETMNPMAYDPDDSEYGFALTESGPLAWCWHPAPGKAENVRLRIVRVDGTTVYEAAVPWTSLKPTGGEIIGLSIVLNNDDGSGRTYVTWGGGLAECKDPRQFRPVRLLKG